MNDKIIEDNMNIKEALIEELQIVVGKDVAITDETLLKEDLGIDSFKAINLLFALENKGIVFKSDKIASIKTVKDLISALTRK